MDTPTFIDRALLDSLVDEAMTSPRRRRNRNFHRHESDAAHRLLNAIEPGSYVPPHRHLDPAKDETMLVVRGSLGVVFFDDAGQPVRYAELRAGSDCIGVDIPHGVFHSVLACEPGTVFFEAKAGPWQVLTEAERAPWAPAENDAQAAAYQASLRALFDAAD
ncbi:WbuC family cupin fold metalloprotein [Rhodocyclus tenuis]|uniref:Cupin fold metalloprotein, WbuC family n=2 Tax=Rhodocyclus TaxID=1064 RepID=A0A6L5JVU1_RHOTE|nr:WbuC family cupin fold metalloprotein [Rhodocyclus gracilis]MQY50734.1 cupin fold metalloprotein, WbuC family [Rhodocyclus gracilis]NJA88266.1 WbuC family cupin fold metalloprotein [Rhodocyclus gracilis]